MIWEQLSSVIDLMSFIQVKGRAVRTYGRVCSGTTDEETCPFVVLTANLISNPNCLVNEIVSEGMPIDEQAPFHNTPPRSNIP